MLRLSCQFPFSRAPPSSSSGPFFHCCRPRLRGDIVRLRSVSAAEGLGITSRRASLRRERKCILQFFSLLIQFFSTSTSDLSLSHFLSSLLSKHSSHAPALPEMGRGRSGPLRVRLRRRRRCCYGAPSSSENEAATFAAAAAAPAAATAAAATAAAEEEAPPSPSPSSSSLEAAPSTRPLPPSQPLRRLSTPQLSTPCCASAPPSRRRDRTARREGRPRSRRRRRSRAAAPLPLPAPGALRRGREQQRQRSSSSLARESQDAYRSYKGLVPGSRLARLAPSGAFPGSPPARAEAATPPALSGKATLTAPGEATSALLASLPPPSNAPAPSSSSTRGRGRSKPLPGPLRPRGDASSEEDLEADRRRGGGEAGLRGLGDLAGLVGPRGGLVCRVGAQQGRGPDVRREQGPGARGRAVESFFVFC